MNTQNDKSSNKSYRGKSGVLGILAVLACTAAGPALAGGSGAERLIVEQPRVTYETGRELSLTSPEATAVTALEMQATTTVPAIATNTATVNAAVEAADTAVAAQGSDRILSASVDPEKYAVPGQVHAVDVGSGDNAAGRGEQSAVSAKDDRPLPYALVLVLIALISLVPVSRRRNF